MKSGLVAGFALLGAFILNSNQGLAHDYTIKGRVVSQSDTNIRLSEAVVRIGGTNIYARTDEDGYFIIPRAPEGNLKISVNRLGYGTKIIEYKLSHNLKDFIDLGSIALNSTDIKSSEITVTATRTEKIYSDSPIRTSSINDKIFEQSGAMNLKEGIGFLPGLRVETNCQNCGKSQVRINGLDGQYSQILIDGKAIFSALNNVYGLDQIPAAMIERIETVRGGAGAIYGGNAVAGAINIITKNPENNSLTLNWNKSFTQFSNPDESYQGAASFVNMDKDMGATLFGSVRNRMEWDANGDGFTEIGRLKAHNIGVKAFYQPDYYSKITFSYYNFYEDLRGGDSLDLAPHKANICETTEHFIDQYHLQYESYLGGGADKLSIYTSYQNANRNSYYGAGQDLNAYGDTKDKTWSAGFQYNKIIDDFYGAHILSMGYEYGYDKIEDAAPSYNRFINQETYNHGLYIQDDWEPSQIVDFVFGLRAEKHNLIDKFILSPRANVLVKPFKSFALRGGVSTGYRAPQAFDEDLHVNQVGGTGQIIKNASNLKVEYSLSYNLSLEYAFNILNLPIALSLEFFDTDLDNAFKLEEQGADNSGNTVLLRKNGSSASVRGVCFEAEVSPYKDFALKASLTAQKSEYSDAVEWSVGDSDKGIAAQSSNKILRTPNVYGHLTANYSINENLDCSLSGIYTGSMYAAHYAGGLDKHDKLIERDKLEKTKDFFELNAKVSYKIKNAPNIKIYLGVQNIFNQFQDDYDKGANRDSAYIYGPSRPRTGYLGVELGM
jgi:outer membrane receptor for ferrienterochelin and colicins